MICGRKSERVEKLINGVEKNPGYPATGQNIRGEGEIESTVTSQISPNPLPRLNSFRRGDAVNEIPR